MRFIILLSLSFLCGVKVWAHRPVVVCVHGIMRSSASMGYAEMNLRKDGYHVVNWDYPSRLKTIEQHGADLAEEVARVARVHPGAPLYFVIHSMGGLVLRAALNHPRCPEAAKKGKAVLYAPPNQGSSFGRKMGRYALAQRIYGQKAGRELMTDTDFDRLGQFPKGMKVLVIAGTLNWNPLIKEPSDGTVRVVETDLQSEHTKIEMPVGHTLIMWSPKVLRATLDFLKR